MKIPIDPFMKGKLFFNTLRKIEINKLLNNEHFGIT